MTIQAVDDDEKKVDDVPVDTDVEKLELPVLENSPLEEEEFPEGGRGWFVVLGCFIYSALSLGWPYVLLLRESDASLTLGLSLSWGVFQAYYKKHVPPNTSDTTLSLLGTLQTMVSAGFRFLVFVGLTSWGRL